MVLLLWPLSVKVIPKWCYTAVVIILGVLFAGPIDFVALTPMIFNCLLLSHSLELWRGPSSEKVVT